MVGCDDRIADCKGRAISPRRGIAIGDATAVINRLSVLDRQVRDIDLVCRVADDGDDAVGPAAVDDCGRCSCAIQRQGRKRDMQVLEISTCRNIDRVADAAALIADCMVV